MNTLKLLSTLILLLVSTDKAVTQEVCGKYVCGFGAACIEGFCTCVNSSSKRLWVLVHIPVSGGMKLSYCQKPCDEDGTGCPSGAACEHNFFSNFFDCVCPEGQWLPTTGGACTGEIPTTLSTLSARTATTRIPDTTTTRQQATTRIPDTTTTRQQVTSPSTVATRTRKQDVSSSTTTVSTIESSSEPQSVSSRTTTTSPPTTGADRCSANTCGHGAKCVSDKGDCVCEYQDRNNDWIMRDFQGVRICVKVCGTTNTRCPQNTECSSVPDSSGFRLCECAPGYNRSETGQCVATTTSAAISTTQFHEVSSTATIPTVKTSMRTTGAAASTTPLQDVSSSTTTVSTIRSSSEPQPVSSDATTDSRQTTGTGETQTSDVTTALGSQTNGTGVTTLVTTVEVVTVSTDDLTTVYSVVGAIIAITLLAVIILVLVWFRRGKSSERDEEQFNFNKNLDEDGTTFNYNSPIPFAQSRGLHSQFPIVSSRSKDATGKRATQVPNGLKSLDFVNKAFFEKEGKYLQSAPSDSGMSSQARSQFLDEVLDDEEELKTTGNTGDVEGRQSAAIAATGTANRAQGTATKAVLGETVSTLQATPGARLRDKGFFSYDNVPDFDYIEHLDDLLPDQTNRPLSEMSVGIQTFHRLDSDPGLNQQQAKLKRYAKKPQRHAVKSTAIVESSEIDQSTSRNPAGTDDAERERQEGILFSGQSAYQTNTGGIKSRLHRGRQVYRRRPSGRFIAVGNDDEQGGNKQRDTEESEDEDDDTGSKKQYLSLGEDIDQYDHDYEAEMSSSSGDDLVVGFLRSGSDDVFY